MTTTHSQTTYELGPWDLSELLTEPTEAVLARELAGLEEATVAFEAIRPRLSPTMARAELLDILRQYEALEETRTRVGSYASLWFSSDTQSPAALSFRNRMMETLTQTANRVLFFTLWWKDLEEADAERLLPSHGESADFRFFLEDERRFKPFTLGERSEQILNLKNANGSIALTTLYSMLTNRLEFEVELEGETRVMADSEVRSHFFSPDYEVRAKIYRMMYEVYRKESEVLAQIYAHRVRDWHTDYVQLRGFASPIAVRNLFNDVPDEAVETLLETIREHAPLFQEYYQLKAGFLAKERLERYDLYAPLATSESRTEWGTAVRDVLQTFDSFDGRFAELAERVFDQQHIDSEIRKGKRSGAFCSTVLPRFTPWVMLTFTGRVRDVATLAHELGHAVHSMLANDHSVLTQHPSLPLAETASVFSEMLMTDRLLAKESDPRARRDLLASAMDDIYATVMRQAFFVRFEIDAHRAVMEGKTSEDLSDLYMANLEDQLGPAMDIGPEFRYEWLSIPHMFNTPFYCYAYSFGQLLVLALYRRYQEEGDAFKPGYFQLLSAGGAGRPTELLAEMGIDIADPGFWRGGFNVVRSLLDELKALGDV